MRDYLKKRDDEMLVVHAPHAPADRVGREPVAPGAELLTADVDALAVKLRAGADAAARARLLATIQGRFGNAFAARVVEASQRGQTDGPPPNGATSGTEKP
ncbi:MAG: hypothetical protein ABJA98_06565 [Acidobacteriota bacterium]